MKNVVIGALFSIIGLGLASCEPTKANPKTPEASMKDNPVDSRKVPEQHDVITLGGGCFWCVEAVYQQLEGVHAATSGYMGGHVENPTYEQVCSKTSGHVEVVQLKFDPEIIPLEDILAWFWELHDPTTKDRQGADVGPQYRSAIFFGNDGQKAIAEASLKAAQEHFDKPIVTEIRKAPTFYPAEDLHQNYYFLNKNSNGYCRAVIQPKLKKLKLRD